MKKSLLKIKIMKIINQFFDFIFLTLILIFLFSSNTQANEVEQSEYTESYKKWISLEKSEKEKYIEPLPFSIKYTNTSTKFKLFSSLKSTTPNKYSLPNNMIIKNQKSTHGCWAFSTTSMIESNIEKLTGSVFSQLSTRHMEYTTAKNFQDGINLLGFNRTVGSGGNSYIALAYCTNGNGPILETEMPFEDNEDMINLEEIREKTPVKQIEDYVMFPNICKKFENDTITYYNGYSESNAYSLTDVQNIRNSIKSHIINYGAVTASMYCDSKVTDYYNQNKYAYNCSDGSKMANHSVTIVGWDDDFPKENFTTQPSNPGAYKVLNSWGESFGESGYMYVSYEDIHIEDSIIGIKQTSNIDYNKIYQYDPLGCNMECRVSNSGSSAYAGNVFIRDIAVNKIEKLSEIGFFIASKTSVQVYVNPQNSNLDLSNLTLVKNMETLEPGYHTCKLDVPIQLTGEKFAVVIKYNNTNFIPLEYNCNSNDSTESSSWDTATSSRNESFVSANGTNWKDILDLGIKDSNTCIKAFTVYEEIINASSIILNTTSKTLNINESFTPIATITPSNTTNKIIQWTSSNSSIATVDSNGKITAVSKGIAIITATTNNKKQATCAITVNQPPIANIAGTGFKTNGLNVVCIPNITVLNIKSVATNAIIKNISNQEILSGIIGTGYTIEYGGYTYNIIKKGDINGDGNITPADYVKVKNHIMKVTNLSGIYVTSSDVNNDGNITPADYVKIKNHIMKISQILL